MVVLKVFRLLSLLFSDRCDEAFTNSNVYAAMTIGPARYKTLSLDEDLDGIDDIPTTCVQDCILLAFKRVSKRKIPCLLAVMKFSLS